MKRFLCLVLALSVVFTTGLAGCAKETGDSTATSIAAGATTAAEQQKPSTWLTDTLTEITIATADNHYLPKSYNDNELPVFQKLEELTNIKIKFDAHPGKEWQDTIMDTIIAAGSDLPDIIFGASNSDPLNWLQGGQIIDLAPLINENAPGIKNLLETMPMYAYRLKNKSGQIVGISGLNTSKDYQPVMLYNQKWFDKIGMAIPNTTDELYATLKAMSTTDCNGDGKQDEIPLTAEAPYWLVNLIGDSFNAHLHDAWWYDENRKIYYTETTDRAKQTYQYLKKLFAEKLLDQAYLTTNYDRLLSNITNDTVGVTAGWPEWANTFNAANVNAKWVTGAPLEGPNGKPLLMERDPVDFGRAMITKDAKDPVLCIKLLDFILTSEEGKRLTQYGVEGLSYTLDGSGNPVFNDFILKNPEGLSPQDAIWSIGGQPNIPYQQSVTLRELTLPADAIETNRIMTTEYTWVPYFPAHGFNMDSDTSDKFWNEFYLNWYTTKDETQPLFIVGKKSFDQWDEYVAKFKTFNYDEVMKIQQQCTDEYFNLSGK